MKSLLIAAVMVLGPVAHADTATAYTCVDLGHGRYGLYEWTATERKRIAAYAEDLVTEKGELQSPYQQCWEIANYFNNKLKGR